jgi:RNA polymerase subunit RPABC4/transcription elongation factor Spt4
MVSIKRCPVCGARSSLHEAYCATEGCGAPMWSVAPIEEEEETGQVRSSAACPNCQYVNGAGAQFCEVCLTRLVPATGRGAGLGLWWPWGFERIRASLLIGRDLSSPLSPHLNLYPNISRQHAHFRVSDSAVFLCDLNSVNGTYLNGQRLAPDQEVEIRPGMTIRFASNLSVKVVGGNDS